MSRESARRFAPGTVAAVAALVFAATPFADAAAGKAETTRTPVTGRARAATPTTPARVNGYRATRDPDGPHAPAARRERPLPELGAPARHGDLRRRHGPARPAGPRGPRDRRDRAVSTPRGS